MVLIGVKRISPKWQNSSQKLTEVCSHDAIKRFSLDSHDITGKDKKKQGKQVGSQPKGWGSIYVAESENCAVKELSNGEWTCFKIGLASDGEASSFKIKCDQATGNSGNYSQVRNYPVKNVGKAEATAHQI